VSVRPLHRLAHPIQVAGVYNILAGHKQDFLGGCNYRAENCGVVAKRL